MEENNNDKKLSKHELKKLKKEQKLSSNDEHNNKIKRKKIIKYSITTLVLILLIYVTYIFIIAPIKDFKPYTNGPIHWHANFEVDICGEKKDFTKGYDFEDNRKGSLEFHSHNDEIIHIESQVIKKEDLALGNFFDAINVQFSESQIMNKNNGDLCPNSNSGKVHMYINDIENYEFRKFIIRQCDSKDIEDDCDKIKIKFE